jgi:excisionase family DNA binding protein
MSQMANEHNEKNRLTIHVSEFAKLLGVSQGLIYNQIRSGEIKAIKIGRKVVISRRVVEEILGHPLPETENNIAA